jgi:hypothetical protein
MPIRIIRRGVAPAPAPLVEDAVVAKAVTEERTPAVILKEWDRIPPPHAKPTTCKWCGKQYLQPDCHFDRTEAMHHGCMNFQFAEMQRGRKSERIDKDAVRQGD